MQANTANRAALFRGALFIWSSITLAQSYVPNQWYKLNYYTHLSNILVWLGLAYLLYLHATKQYEALDSDRILRGKALVTIGITLTFLVYALLLAPTVSPASFWTINNLSIHYIIPVATIVDWFVFDRHGAYKPYDILVWTIFPLSYLAFALIKGAAFGIPIPHESHSPYPYFFLDINQQGVVGVTIYIVVIWAFYLLLGCAYYALKRKAAPRHART